MPAAARDLGRWGSQTLSVSHSAARLPAEVLAQEVAHHPDLADAVRFGNEGQDGLVETAAEKLDLAAPGELLDQVPAGPFVLFHVLPERAGKVEGEAEAGMAGEALEQRPVAIGEGRLEDVIEVAHRLVVVDGEKEVGAAHVGQIPSWARM